MLSEDLSGKTSDVTFLFYFEKINFLSLKRSVIPFSSVSFYSLLQELFHLIILKIYEKKHACLKNGNNSKIFKT